MRPQPLDAADVQLDVLAAGADDLVVEHPVALVGGEVVRDQVPLGEGGQDADQHDLRVGLGRPLVGAGEAAAQVLLVVGEAGALDQPGRGVELQVELAQLGLEERVGDVGEDLLVAHGRLGRRVDQVELDLQPGHRPVGVEAEVVQHQREDVQAPPDLLPVTDAVLPGEGALRDVPAHVSSRRLARSDPAVPEAHCEPSTLRAPTWPGPEAARR